MNRFDFSAARVRNRTRVVWLCVAALASLLCCGVPQKGSHAMEYGRDEFTELVGTFATAGPELEVGFSRRAAVYRLPVTNPDFVAMVTVLATAYKSAKPVRVVVRVTEIKSVTLP